LNDPNDPCARKNTIRVEYSLPSSPCSEKNIIALFLYLFLVIFLFATVEMVQKRQLLNVWPLVASLGVGWIRGRGQGRATR
jgi:hypothetical protein